MPEVCFCCSFDLSTVDGIWCENAAGKLLEMFSENELLCKISTNNDDGVLVKLYCDGEDILSHVLEHENVSVTKVIENNKEIHEFIVYEFNIDDKKDVTCSHIESPKKLWCQLSTNEAELNDLMNHLDEVYGSLGPEDLLAHNYDVGSPCCGQFLEDDGWYRAEIVEVVPEGLSMKGFLCRNFLK